MSITIFSAEATPHTVPNGTTTSITVSFKGIASVNNAAVRVVFTVFPFPDLSFGGEESKVDNYIFNAATGTFSKTFSLQNAHSPASSSPINGQVALIATENNTGYADGTYAVLLFY